MFGRHRAPDVFETVLVEEGRIRLFERHLLRLKHSGVKSSKISSVRSLAETWKRTAREPLIVRFDVPNRSAVTATPRKPVPTHPVRLATVGGYSPRNLRRQMKLMDRDWADARESATPAGTLPLLVSEDRLVGETTRHNLFVIGPNETVLTPPFHGLLPGVTRGWVVEQLGQVDRVQISSDAPVSTSVLRDAEAAFVTNAAYGVVPVAEIDGRQLEVHPLAKLLASRWRALE